MLLWNPHTLTFSFEVPEMPASEGVQKILGIAIGLKHHRVDYFPYFHRSNSILLGASAAKDNGVRVVDSEYRMELDKTIKNLLEQHKFKFNTIEGYAELSGTTEERIQKIKQVMSL